MRRRLGGPWALCDCAGTCAGPGRFERCDCSGPGGSPQPVSVSARGIGLCVWCALYPPTFPALLLDAGPLPPPGSVLVREHGAERVRARVDGERVWFGSTAYATAADAATAAAEALGIPAPAAGEAWWSTRAAVTQ